MNANFSKRLFPPHSWLRRVCLSGIEPAASPARRRVHGIGVTLTARLALRGGVGRRAHPVENKTPNFLLPVKQEIFPVSALCGRPKNAKVVLFHSDFSG